MALHPEDLPRDHAALVEIVLGYDGENEGLRAEIARLKTLIFGVRSVSLRGRPPFQNLRERQCYAAKSAL
jgi:hypothetical protein